MEIAGHHILPSSSKTGQLGGNITGDPFGQRTKFLGGCFGKFAGTCCYINRHLGVKGFHTYIRVSPTWVIPPSYPARQFASTHTGGLFCRNVCKWHKDIHGFRRSVFYAIQQSAFLLGQTPVLYGTPIRLNFNIKFSSSFSRFGNRLLQFCQSGLQLIPRVNTVFRSWKSHGPLRSFKPRFNACYTQADNFLIKRVA